MRRLNHLMFAALTFVCAAFFVSCSSTDEDVLSVDTEFTTTGIHADAFGGQFEIPVKSSGKYTVTDGDVSWIQTRTTGEGDGVVCIQVWPNYGEEPRQSNVVLEGEGHKITVPITQEFYDDGLNDDANRPMFMDIARTKGVGYGLDIETLTPKDNVVDMVSLRNLVQKNEHFTSFIIENRMNRINYNDAILDSIEIKNDTLGVNASVDISYGLFHLNVKGSYLSSETKKDSLRILRMAGNYPFLTEKVSIPSLIRLFSQYRANPDNVIKRYSMDTSTADNMEFLINESFLEKIEEAQDLIKDSDETYKEVVKEIVDDYGAVITTGSTMGGKINLRFTCGSTEMADTMKINGSVDTNVKNALLDLTVGVNVGYSKLATSLLKGSETSAIVFGGSQTLGSELIQAFKSQEADTAKIFKVRKEWINSIKLGSDDTINNTEVVSFTYLPLWSFFNRNSRNKVRDVILERYKNSVALPLLRDNSGFVTE